MRLSVGIANRGGRPSRPPGGLGRVAWILGFLTAIALVPHLSCKSQKQSELLVTAARSKEAQAELRKLEEEWELSGSVGRRELREPLEDFLEEHGSDPSAGRARILLAQIALLERRLDSAEALIGPLLEGPPGLARDEAQVIMAAIDNRRGNPQGALFRLAPLEGKLLTRPSRDQYSRERIRAALETESWPLSVEVMTDWLEDAGPKARDVKKWIETSVVEIPQQALADQLDVLEAEPEADDSSARSSARKWLHRRVVEHLAEEALRHRDAQLARDLLRRAPPWLRASPRGDELVVLAALAEKDARVIGRGVGVVLSSQDELTRRRSVRVALGLLEGLDLGRAEGAPSGIRLLAVEERASTRAALGMLSGRGASILVAGVDEAGALEALQFAQARRVPVVTLSDPRVPVSSPYGFILGEGVESQRSAMKDGFTEQGTWVFLGPSETPCTVPGARPGAQVFPLAEWQGQDVVALGVLDDVLCAKRALQQLKGLSYQPAVIVGLEAAHWIVDRKHPAFGLVAADFPPPAPALEGDEISPLEKEILAGAPPPEIEARDWYFHLGLDAAQLIGQALRALPQTGVTEKEAVRVRHQLARDALARARATLRTTRSRGFSPSGRLERELQLRPLQGAEDGG